MIIIGEQRFNDDIVSQLAKCAGQVRSVTGPGRSGAIAAVYASYILKVPFIPYGQRCPDNLKPILVIDTARKTGKTIRSAERKYDTKFSLCLYDETEQRFHFWYERILKNDNQNC